MEWKERKLVLNQFRNIRFAALLTSVLLLTTSCASTTGTGQVDLPAMITPGSTAKESGNYTTYAENNELRLLIDEGAAAIRVEDKQSGAVWDSLAASESTGGDQGILQLEYLSATGNIANMTAAADCVQKGQYTIDKIDNGAHFAFTFGNVQENLICPPVIPVERFEEIISGIQSRFDKAVLTTNYRKIVIEEITDKVSRGDLLAKYPGVKDQPLYVLHADKLAATTAREIDRILRARGYTEAEFIEHSALASAENNKQQDPVFTVHLYARLSDKGLEVSVPVKEIVEYNDALLLRLAVLQNFGAPKWGEQGYFVLPDGSGSIMNFGNGLETLSDYSVPVYGRDSAIPYDFIMYEGGEASLPMWGIVRDTGSMLAALTDGEAMAEVQAFPGNQQFNAYAGTNFRVREYSKVTLSTSSQNNDFMYFTQDKLYDGALQIAYRFYDKGTDYSQLAVEYGKMIFGESTPGTAQTPVYVEFIGSADKTVQFAGINRLESVTLTTLKQVRESAEALHAAGVSPLVLKLTGFVNGGIDNTYFNDVKLCKNVGTVEELKDLYKWANENSVTVYLDCDVQAIGKKGSFDGFSVNDDAVFFINRLVANKQTLHPATLAAEDVIGSYLLNATATVRSIRTVWGDIQGFGSNAVSLRNLGKDLFSNYRKQNAAERQGNLNEIRPAVEEINKAGGKILTNGANRWMLPYATDLLETPVSSYQFKVTNNSVPLLQLAMQNRRNYASSAINLSGDANDDILRLIETGSGLYYTVTGSGSSSFIGTAHREYYATDFKNQQSNIIEMYKKFNEVFKGRNGVIAGHEILSEGVHKTVYTDGFYTIVNYTMAPYTVGTETVPAGGYLSGRNEVAK